MELQNRQKLGEKLQTGEASHQSCRFRGSPEVTRHSQIGQCRPGTSRSLDDREHSRRPDTIADVLISKDNQCIENKILF